MSVVLSAGDASAARSLVLEERVVAVAVAALPEPVAPGPVGAFFGTRSIPVLGSLLGIGEQF